MVLQRRGGRETLEKAMGLCDSVRARERELGANVLNEFGGWDNPFAEEVLPVLSRLCLTDDDPEVLSAAAASLSKLNDPRALEPLLALVANPHAGVRFDAACALPSALDDRAPDERGARALMALMEDDDELVRDWATFGLGTQLEQFDAPETREALAGRLDDPD